MTTKHLFIQKASNFDQTNNSRGAKRLRAPGFPSLAGDSPPSYGRSDINVVQSTWLQGGTRKGAANSGKSNQNAHFCEYMSSELGKPKKSEQRPLCRGATGGKGRPPCVATLHRPPAWCLARRRPPSVPPNAA